MGKGTILYIGNFELPDKGASANRVVANAKLFNELDYQTVLLGVSKDKACTEIRSLTNDYGILMYERPYPASMRMWINHMFSADAIEKMLAIYENTVLVILYNMPFSAFMAAKKVCKKRNIRVAYDCTEWTDVTEGNAIKRLVKKRDEKLIRNKLAEVADGLIVISSMMEQQYTGCPAMIKLPPLVDTEDKIWHQEPQEHAWFEFCFAGMLDGQKDSLDIVVKAFASVCDNKTKLRIIGVEENEFRKFYPEAKSYLDKCGEQIVFMGRQSHFDTIRYVLSCDCYIFIRKSDLRNNAGFPTKFVEAFTCGVPLITTDVSDLKDFKEDRIHILTSPREAEISMAMDDRKNNKSSKKTIQAFFDYKTYKKSVDLWLINVINGGIADERR